MIRKCFAIGLIGAALGGLSGCDRQEPSPVQPGTVEGSGAARIAFPALPSGYLDSAQKAWFSLTITGPGMAPIMKSWMISPDHAQPILVEGIPAGMRAFHGRLIRIDDGKHDTTVTHEGLDSAEILRGSVAEVHLFLKAGGLGAAHVCVEVEGWPADPACIPPPAPKLNAAGCYTLRVSKKGRLPGQDTVVEASLQIEQRDSVISGTVTWSPGETDVAQGSILNDEVVYLGWSDNQAGFVFKSVFDSTGALQGDFRAKARGVVGFAQAAPVPCRTDTSPSMAGCYRFRVTKPGIGKDTVFQGKLSLVQQGSAVQGTVEWGNGRIDTASGLAGGDAVSIGGTGTFSLKAHPDPAGLWGFFDDPLRGISGSVRADAEPCGTPVSPDTILTKTPGESVCYAVTQINLSGDTLRGGLALTKHAVSSDLDVYLRLERMGFFTVKTAYFYGTLDDESWMGFSIWPEDGMSGDGTVKEVRYDLHLPPTGDSAGTVFKRNPPSRRLGTLRAKGRVCRETDFRE